MRNTDMRLVAPTLIACGALVLASGLVGAEPSECTDAAIDAAEAYDLGSSAALTCIKKRRGFDIVVTWNSNAYNPKIFNTTKGVKVGQQVVNVRNLVRDYSTNYGMEHGSEYNAVVVAYAGGLDWLLTTTDQQNQDFVNAQLAAGIRIFACLNTMQGKNLKVADLIPGVEVVPAGVTAVVDFTNQKYRSLVP
jgi:intracellular sulfur oxidation DsrE/DsrF family protein